MQEILLWQRRLRWLLTPPGVCYGLATRLAQALYAKHALPGWNPKAPSVGVGAISVGAWGETLVTAWILGWAAARGLKAAALVHPGPGRPSEPPLTVQAGVEQIRCGAQAALLARYRPEALVLADANPARAGKAAWKVAKPEFYVLSGHFSATWARRGADIVLLTPQDLDKGWNRPLPAGLWRESAHSLGRAGAFVLSLSPEEIPQRSKLAERRLARFGKPVFTLHPQIWRLRRPAGSETADSLGGEAYLLVAGQSHQDVAARAAQRFLGQAPRFQVIVPDSHQFTDHDRAQIAQDAQRMRAPHVLVTPEIVSLLGDVPGRTVWTYDPDVVLGPCLLGGPAFASWWEGLAATLPGWA